MTGNLTAFHELGLHDADELVIKSQLMTEIVQRLQARGLTQTRAAAEMCMPRSEVSHLVNGRIARFTIDRLVRALATLDATVHVRLVVEPRDGSLAS
jgi:predicted XRE-type DNA-binding protein